MAIYVVGDIQGCFSCLERLLDKVSFAPPRDSLWAVGDLVNRGPESLETLRFCSSLGAHFRTVLGNHDLHLIAVARGLRAPNHKDTLAPILNAPDKHHLIEWLESQPLLIRHQDYTLVHAGLPPQWTIDEAAKRAREVEVVLANPKQRSLFLRGMYGNEPRRWSDELQGIDRWRLITNYLTRMRYCDASGGIELINKEAPSRGPQGYLPWYAHKHRKSQGERIVFGHWASLDGVALGRNLFPLDTGCVWGGRLRLLNLNTGHFTHHSCRS